MYIYSKITRNKMSAEFFNGMQKIEDLADQAYFKTSGDSLNPSTVTSIKTGKTSTTDFDYGVNAAGGIKVNGVSFQDNNGNTLSVGNVNLNAKVNNNGLLFGLDANRKIN